MKRNPEDPEGQYEAPQFCAEEGWCVSLTGERREKTITDMVVEDLRERERVGYKKYGKALQPFDGRDSHQDLYEELLDAAQYIKKAMIERERLEREDTVIYCSDLPDI